MNKIALYILVGLDDWTAGKIIKIIMANNMESVCLDDWTAEWVTIASNCSHIVDDIDEILRDTVRLGHSCSFKCLVFYCLRH